MSKNLIIGVDAGTSMTKAIAFDLGGRQVESASLRNNYVLRPDGGAEQSMPQTWADCVCVLKKLGQKVHNLAKRTAAIALTGQGDGTWLIDDQGEPVMDAWLWLDARAAAAADDIRASPADETRFKITGTGINACQMGAQLIHMRRYYDDALAKADCAFHCKDWLYFNLTGVKATDPSEGNFTFGDYKTRNYSDEVIDILGLQAFRRLLPDMVDGATSHHPLTETAAAATGLHSGTPVVLGFVDVVCTALGAGAYGGTEAVGCTIVGSTGVHIQCENANTLRLNAHRTGYLMAMPISGVVAQLQTNMASALNIDWLLNVANGILTDFGQSLDHAQLVDKLEEWLGQSVAGHVMYHPYISEAGERGPFINSKARAAFNGLNANHRFPDLVRGVVEGLAMAARDCYSAMGALPDKVRLAGGAARSPALRHIMANALQAETSYSRRDEAGAAGAAMIAAISIGAYDTMNACIADWVDPFLTDGSMPDNAALPVYDQLFEAYSNVRLGMTDIWPMLDNLREQADR